MRFFVRSILSLGFFPLFLIFLILTSFKFQLLNYEYLSSNFEENKIYDSAPAFQQAVLIEQAKRGSKGDEIDIELSPLLAKQFIERNLKSILTFLNGESKQAILYVPNMGNVELVSISTYFSKEALDKIQQTAGFIFPVWVGLLILLLIIIVVHFKLGWAKDKYSEIYFITLSIIILILGLLGRFFLTQMARDLVDPSSGEPSQILLGLMARSILPEILNLWILIALGMFFLTVGILILKKIFIKPIQTKII